MRPPRRAAILTLLYLANPSPSPAGRDHPLEGKWEMIPARSTDIDLFGAVGVEIRETGKSVTVIDSWGRGRSIRDSVTDRKSVV
jgi:hypothetical protein